MNTDPGDMKSCIYCGQTSGVKTIPDTAPRVLGWSCSECGTEWWFTVVNHRVRPWWRQFTEDLEVFAVLQEITALAGEMDAITDDQMRARLIECWARLDRIRRSGTDPHAPAGHRLNNEVPGGQPVSRFTGAAPDGTGTGTTR